MEETEIHAAIRHYSALRFAMLSVFAAITGALLSAKYSPELVANDVQVSLCFFQASLVSFIGFWVSVVFLIFEVALNFYLCGLWGQLPRMSPKPVYRRGYITWPVRLAAISLPFGGVVLWCLL